MRNVKESSSNNPPSTSAASSQDIQLLFRARRADNTYIWLDCPGKLHADTSRGRKALLLRLREIEMPRMVWSAINTSGGVSREDCYLRVARDDRGLVVACLKGVEDVLGRKGDQIVGKTLADMVVDNAEKEAIKTGLGVGDAACGELPDSKAPQVVVCNMPVSVVGKGRRGNLTEDTPNTIIAATEMTFFPPLPMKPCSGDGTEQTMRDDDASTIASWRMKPQTLVVRIRVLQRQGMGTDPASMAMTNPYSSSSDSMNVLASSSSLQTPATGFYGNELPFVSSLMRAELPLPVGRRVARRQAFQVQLTGNVNVVDDSVSVPIPSPPSLSSHHADGGGTSGSSEPLADMSTASNTAGTGMAGSSWQYELQQLRMKNEKLRSELAAVKKDRRMKQREEIARRPTFESHGATSSSGGVVDHARPVSMPMAWGGGFTTPTSAGGGMAGPSHSVSFPTSLSMPPPPQPLPSSSSHPHGYETPSDTHNKRTWSQTDMHSEWNQWGR